MEDFAARSNGWDQSDCHFKPGEVVLESGLYEICHYNEPRARVILTLRGIFPFCRRCGDKVRYRLLQAVPHISEDPDFKEAVRADNLQAEMVNQKYNFPLQLGWAHGFRFCQETAQARRDGAETGDL